MLYESRRRARPENGDHDQRRRLLDAVIELSAHQGYEQVTVADIVKHAQTSRSTFYKHFSERQGCLLAAFAGIADGMLDTITVSVEGNPPERALTAAVSALTKLALSEPMYARVLMSEAMTGGRRALDARDSAIDRLAEVIDRAQARAGAPEARIPGLASALVIGAAQRMLASRLRRGEQERLAELPAGLAEWLGRYGLPLGAYRLGSTIETPTPARSSYLPDAPLRPPPPRARGRRPPSGALIEGQRLRITLATAAALARTGYEHTSVTEIMREAEVDGRLFYSLFDGKQDALMAVHELVFQRTMAVTAGAFFSAEGWPARVWDAARALTQFLEQNPALAHAALVESYAGGSQIAQRQEELMAGYTIFLQEGYDYMAEGAAPPSRLALDAVAAVNIEALYRELRKPEPQASRLAGQLCFACLASFVGAARASELVEQLSGARAAQSAPA